MGSIDMIKPLSTVLSSAVNKSQHHQENNYQREKFLGMLRIKPGAVGVKPERYHLCYVAPHKLTSFIWCQWQLFETIKVSLGRAAVSPPVPSKVAQGLHGQIGKLSVGEIYWNRFVETVLRDAFVTLLVRRGRKVAGGAMLLSCRLWITADVIERNWQKVFDVGLWESSSRSPRPIDKWNLKNYFNNLNGKISYLFLMIVSRQSWIFKLNKINS